MKRIILTLSLIWAAILSYAQGTSLTRSEATDILLGECISQARSSMPMDFGAYSIDDIKLTKTSVTYSNTIPDKAAFNQSKSQAENLKVNTLTSFLSQKNQLLLTFMMCIESNRSLRYEYSCPAAGASFHFDITPSEMKELYDIGTITNAYRKEVITTYLENVSETPFTIDNDVYSPVIFVEGSVKNEMDGVGDYETFFRDILSESIQNHEGGAIFPAIAVYLGVGLNEVLTDKTGESITLKIRYSELVDLYKRVSSTYGTAQTNFMDDIVIDDLDDEPIPFQLVEVKPSFQGGDANKFSTWVNTQLQYPKIAKDNDVQGRVTLQFTVDVDGSVTNVKVLRGVDPSLDNEAMRVVRMSPKWTPGRQKGKPVRVTYTFPVIFQLTDNSQGRSSVVPAPSNRIETNDHKWEVLSVEIRDDCTYIHKTVTPKSSPTAVWSEATEFIEDVQTGKKYYLTNSTIGTTSLATTLNGKNPLNFTETYPALPASVQYINISSGSQYYVKNLKIR